MTSGPTFSAGSLRLARLRAGLTQLHVAERCTQRGERVDQAQVSQWENGRSSPLVSKLPVLAEVLGCTVDDFLIEPASPRNAEAVAS